jgi:RimJ/RimL family protein N-acetyltransferase
MNEQNPVGPAVDPWPRLLPARTRIDGRFVTLEPLHRRFAADLWQAVNQDGAAASFTYMPYGPFDGEAALTRFIADNACRHDPIFWALRPIVSGKVEGWMSLMEIEPAHAAIELGSIWLAPSMRRTRAATEAMFLLLERAASELGYRRLVWKCDSLNAPSIAAAKRLGFTYEGTLRAHRVVRGRRRDTAMFSILDDEWPRVRTALLAWLDPANFDATGTAINGLAALRQ